MTRLVRSLVLAAALGSCLASAPAAANPYTAYFDTLRTKVVELRDALAEPLTKPERKRLLLLEKILAAMDEVSASFAADLATGKAVAATVVKGLLDDPELPDVVFDLLTNLGADVKARLDALAARTAGLPSGSLATKTQKAVDKARASLAKADAAAAKRDLRKMAAALLKTDAAAGALEKRLLAAEAASGISYRCLAGTSSSVSATLDGAPFPVDPARLKWEARVYCDTSAAFLDLHSFEVHLYRPTATPLGDNVDEHILFGYGTDTGGSSFTGPGTYGSSVNYVKIGEGQTVSGSGTITITTIDLETPRLVGTADATVRNQLGPEHTITLSFDITCLKHVDFCRSKR